MQKKLALCLILIQVIFVVTLGTFAEYDFSSGCSDGNRTVCGDDEKIPSYYSMFVDTHVMIFCGIGLLYTFLKKYSYTGIGMNMLLCAISVQMSLICGNWRVLGSGRIPINFHSFIRGEFAAATTMIALGGVFGKASPLQLVVFTLLEVLSYTTLSHIWESFLQVADTGQAVGLHLFCSVFGLAAAYVLDKKVNVQDNPNEGSSYHSNIFCLIGTMLLWTLWPSFNSSLAVGSAQFRCAINTYLALLSSCVTAFATSSYLHKNDKFSLAHIQNATLAGAVGISSTVDLRLHPGGVLLIGGVSGCLSVLGIGIAVPFLAKHQVHDPCGISGLHAIPGIFAGITGIVMAFFAKEEVYGEDLYSFYPAMAPNSYGEGRLPQIQACYQLLYVILVITMAIILGMMTGFIMRNPAFDPLKEKHMFLDDPFWEVPSEEGSPEKCIDKENIRISAITL